MWSTICQNYTFTDLDQLFYIFLFGWDGANPYMYGDGTSFACPLAAGVCGLVRSRFPSLTPQLVIQHLIATGDAVAYDQPIGVKVNAFRAVTAGPTAVAVDARAPALSLSGAAPNPMAAQGAIRFSLPSRERVHLSLYDVSGRKMRSLVDATLDAGPHSARWDGRNDAGARVAAGVYFARLESGRSRLDSKVLLLSR